MSTLDLLQAEYDFVSLPRSTKRLQTVLCRAACGRLNSMIPKSPHLLEAHNI